MKDENDVVKPATDAEAEYHRAAAELIPVEDALALFDRCLAKLNTVIPGGRGDDTPGARCRRINKLLGERLPNLSQSDRDEIALLISEPFDKATYRILQLWIAVRFRRFHATRRQQ